MKLLILGSTIVAAGRIEQFEDRLVWFNGEHEDGSVMLSSGAQVIELDVPEGFTPQGYDYIEGNVAPRVSPVVLATPEDKAQKNQDINRWREAANYSTFEHSGKVFACDSLSRSDIDGVANQIALNGVFPPGFPGAWKAADNSYLLMPSVEDFKQFYASMTAQGATNFAHAQQLKQQLATAKTKTEVESILW